MQYAIVVSEQDPAGMNIKEQLLHLYPFQKKEDYYAQEDLKLYTIKKRPIDCTGLKVDADVIVFATKHQAVSGQPSLSVHFPGNWTTAQLGGKNRTLPKTPASLLKALFIELNIQGESFKGEITLEATHHGPDVKQPIMFIEIGSSLPQWKNQEYGKIIAKTLMNVLLKEILPCKTFFALGGGHYPREFNKLLLRTEFALGHICPKHMLKHLDSDLVKQAMHQSVEPINTILLDWKGLGPYKEKIKIIAEELNIPTLRVQHLLKTT